MYILHAERGLSVKILVNLCFLPVINEWNELKLPGILLSLAYQLIVLRINWIGILSIIGG